jgi:glutamate/tyrosine decarboxylase-like PLP-dependent enzyme
MAGTRPGGAIAAAWGALMFLGEEGYLKFASQTMDAARALMQGIETIPGFYIIGKPDMSVFTFTANDIDIFAVADHMETKGWRLDRQKKPNCLHMIVTPNHAQAVESFLMDLQAAATEERQNPSKPEQRKKVMLYGVTSNVPEDADLKNHISAHMDDLYKLQNA